MVNDHVKTVHFVIKVHFGCIKAHPVLVESVEFLLPPSEAVAGVDEGGLAYFRWLLKHRARGELAHVRVARESCVAP